MPYFLREPSSSSFVVSPSIETSDIASPRIRRRRRRFRDVHSVNGDNFAQSADGLSAAAGGSFSAPVCATTRTRLSEQGKTKRRRCHGQPRAPRKAASESRFQDHLEPSFQIARHAHAAGGHRRNGPRVGQKIDRSNSVRRSNAPRRRATRSPRRRSTVPRHAQLPACPPGDRIPPVNGQDQHLEPAHPVIAAIVMGQLVSQQCPMAIGVEPLDQRPRQQNDRPRANGPQQRRNRSFGQSHAGPDAQIDPCAERNFPLPGSGRRQAAHQSMEPEHAVASTPSQIALPVAKRKPAPRAVEASPTLGRQARRQTTARFGRRGRNSRPSPAADRSRQSRCRYVLCRRQRSGGGRRCRYGRCARRWSSPLAIRPRDSTLGRGTR